MYELIQRYEQGIEAAIQMQTKLYHINVVFEGTRAFTDGTTITLPNVRAFASHDNITDEDLKDAAAYFMALRGYAWQQAARIVESDLEWLKEWHGMHGSFALAIHNALDDIRIEHRFGRSDPGIKEAIEYMREQWLWPRYIRQKERREFGVDVMHEMLIGMQCMLKHYETLDQHLLWCALDESVQTWVMRNQPDLDSAYDTFKMNKRNGTLRLAEVVERMIARWREEYDLVEPLCPVKPPQAIEDDQSEKKTSPHERAFFAALNRKLGEQRDELLGKEKSGENQMDDIGQLLTAAMKPPLLYVTLGPKVTTFVTTEFDGGYVQRVEPVPALENKDGWASLTKSAWDEKRTLVIHPPDPRLERALDQAMASLVRSLMNTATEMQKRAEEEMEHAKTQIERLPPDQQPYLVYTTRNDRFVETPEGSPAQFATMRNEVIGTVGVIKTRLEVLLRTETRVKWRSNREDGHQIDDNALADLALYDVVPNDDLRLFREQIEQVNPDETVVGLLVDCSGSMQGLKLKLARWTALCFAEALEQSHYRFALFAFSSVSHLWEEPYQAASDSDRQLYGRFGALYVEICKRFDEPWDRVKQRVPYLGSYNDCNYDADSVQWAAAQLLRQKAKRRVLFVMSDGQPQTDEPPVQRARQQRHLGDVVRAIEQQGIEAVGIGICDESVRLYYPHHAVVHRGGDLPRIVLNEMEMLLRRTRR